MAGGIFHSSIYGRLDNEAHASLQGQADNCGTSSPVRLVLKEAECPYSAMQGFLQRLYKTPLITISAIRGACPAGGCILSLLCDSRIMTEAGTIGLNEVALGIPVPYYWAQVMSQVSHPLSSLIWMLLQCCDTSMPLLKCRAADRG